MAAPTESARVNRFYKTTMCKFLPKCRKGEACQFAHDESELRISDETPAESTKDKFFKTKICSSYPRCPDGDFCKFAHGEKDLRAEGPKPLSPVKYKSRDCTHGETCPYKARCFFMHENDERWDCPMWNKTKTCLSGEGGGCRFPHPADH